jgi:hypothetical protein
MFRTMTLTAVAILALGVVYAVPVVCPDSAATGRAMAAPPQIPVNLTIVNATDNSITIYWKNFQGQLVFYKSLDPEGSYVQPTYSSHEWVAVFNGTGVQRRYIMPTYDATWTLQ